MNPTPPDELRRPPGRGQAVIEVLALTAIFLLYSAIHAPVPAAGEPHYLSKARHFHDPAWCRGDFFLESSNAHAVFYASIGWLTLRLPFEIVAWVGRSAGFLLVAVGWRMLAYRLTPFPLSGILSATAYLLLAALGNFSGEWLLDGIEGKVPSYGLLFVGWALLIDRRPVAAALAIGGAISFHPIVGGWGLIAGIAGCLWQTIHPVSETAVEEESPWSWTVVAISFAALVLAASPGVIAAGSALSGGNSRAADYIQVFYRLAHHLDPTTITARAWIGYSILFTGWLLLRPWESRTGSQRWWSGCVLMSLLIALTGAAIGWGPRPPQGVPWLELRMRLMKFYPFRLFDLVMPMAVAFCFAGQLGRWIRNALNPESRRRRTFLSYVIGGGLLMAALIQAKETRFNPPVPSARQEAWRDVCGWIQRETPIDSVFLTPRETWGFKWFAQRPEYVAYKDCPQDPAGIIEWNRRLQQLAKWADEDWKEGYSVAALQRLHEQTGITHILARDLGPFEITPQYDNGDYRVIKIPRSTGETQAPGR